MEIIRLMAEIQANPASLKAYLKVIAYYTHLGMHNEAKAFTDMIAKRFNDNGTNPDPQQ